jgi:glycosyltransferase involved in cell wall biosynthesis
LLEDRGWNLIICPVDEPYLRSFPRAVLRGVRMARTHDADVVHSVNNPFHLHVIGFLVSLLCGLPWLAELRDALVTDPDLNDESPRYYARRLVERLAVTRATKVVWIDGIQLPPDYFDTTYPAHSTKVERLPFLGFVSEHFERAGTASYESFTITYAGSFYPGWLEPFSFLDGLGQYVRDGGDNDLVVQFYGDWREEYQRHAKRRGVADVVRTYDFVPHEEIVPVLKGSDAVLYIGGTDPKNARNVPSKIWDYIASRRPILAIVDPSFRVASFIEDHDLGVVASPGDPGSVAEAIRQLRSGQYQGASEETYQAFSRTRLVDELADVLDRIYDVST